MSSEPVQNINNSNTGQSSPLATTEALGRVSPRKVTKKRYSGSLSNIGGRLSNATTVSEKEKPRLLQFQPPKADFIFLNYGQGVQCLVNARCRKWVFMKFLTQKLQLAATESAAEAKKKRSSARRHSVALTVSFLQSVEEEYKESVSDLKRNRAMANWKLCFHAAKRWSASEKGYQPGTDNVIHSPSKTKEYATVYEENEKEFPENSQSRLTINASETRFKSSIQQIEPNDVITSSTIPITTVEPKNPTANWKKGFKAAVRQSKLDFNSSALSTWRAKAKWNVVRYSKSFIRRVAQSQRFCLPAVPPDNLIDVSLVDSQGGIYPIHALHDDDWMHEGSTECPPLVGREYYALCSFLKNSKGVPENYEVYLENYEILCPNIKEGLDSFIRDPTQMHTKKSKNPSQEQEQKPKTRTKTKNKLTSNLKPEAKTTVQSMRGEHNVDRRISLASSRRTSVSFKGSNRV